MSFGFRAGTSIIDISPGPGIELAGYPHCPRYNTGIHDPLYAGCLYLDNGQTKIAIITMDLLFFSKKYVWALRKRIETKTGIPGKNILLCCSHTHSGPWAAGRLDLEALEKGLKPDAGYIDELQEKLFQLVVDACGNTFDAEIGIGTGYCGREQGVGGNRRVPEGPSDPAVSVLGVRDKEKQLRCCLVGYALHPTVIHSESTVVTADYPGYIRRYFSKVKPGMNLLFAQGTSGNQSSRYFRSGQTFEEADRIGTAIGKEADRVLNRLAYESSLDITVSSVEVDPGLRVLPDRHLAEKRVGDAQEQLNQLVLSGAGYIEKRNAELRLLGAEDICGYAILNEKGIVPDLLSDDLPMEIQAIALGDAVIVGLPGELFVEFGLEIKKRSQFGKTFVFELANGAAPGYIYTQEATASGGYETDTSMLDDACGELLVEKASGLVRKIYQQFKVNPSQ